MIEHQELSENDAFQRTPLSRMKNQKMFFFIFFSVDRCMPNLITPPPLLPLILK